MHRKVLVFVFLILLHACASKPGNQESSGFYTWVDAQGNVHSVAPKAAAKRPESPLSSAVDESTQPPAAAQDDPQASAEGAPTFKQRALASTPDELWAMSDDGYISQEELDAKLEQRERDRFVSYPDEQGRLVPRAVDLPAEREARNKTNVGYEEIGEATVEFTDTATQVTASCCAAGVVDARVLSVDTQVRLNFSSRNVATVMVNGRHPALTFALDQSVAAIELEAWLTRAGYLHPQLIYLDQNAVPMLLVDNVFSRRYPETLFRHPSLFGKLPVPEGARWVVVYLAYVERHRDENQLQSGAMVSGQEPEVPLALQGDAVLRALAE